MAKIEIANLGIFKAEQINICDIVGVDEKNKTSIEISMIFFGLKPDAFNENS